MTDHDFQAAILRADCAAESEDISEDFRHEPPPSYDDDEGIGTVRAARALGCSSRTVVKLIEDGALPGYRIGRVWRTTRRAVREFINRGGSR